MTVSVTWHHQKFYEKFVTTLLLFLIPDHSSVR